MRDGIEVGPVPEVSPVPAVGAVPVDAGRTRFAVWAPDRRRVGLCASGTDGVVDLPALGGGYFGAVVDGCAAGTRYRYLLDDEGPFADPASRSQPEGVHGPSEVVDLRAHRWADAAHRPGPLREHVIYEVHVGAFTAEGTLDAAAAALDELVEVGVSAVELMPVAQFPGSRNWGYDGVFPFAVQSTYGGAAALQRFVDACHQRGLDVILDVVYNHLGPEGNVLGDFGPYFTDRYRTPWGPAVNFDGPASNDVRAYFIQNARQWFSEFHIDGLRLDAVHEIIDRTARPFLAELADAVGDLGDRLGRRGYLVAESADNNPRVVTPTSAGGFGMDAQWNDDFHHALHASITGERAGYYADFGPVEDIATAMDEGFVFQGGFSVFRGRNHGAPSRQLAPERLVVYAQNHDQIGNRPGGDRLCTLVTVAQARLATALVLLAPGVPMLFMGEEYADPAPFPYFIDHGDPALVEAVRAGRAHDFAGQARPGTVLDVADPSTFDAARLDRSLRGEGDHRARWALHRSLIGLRRANPALRCSPVGSARAWATAGVVTLVRSEPLDVVVTLFNVSADPADGVLPAVPAGWAGAGGGPSWNRLLDGGSPELGGRGATLPATAAPGEAVPLGPWEFCAYHLAPAARAEGER
jgi:maltooligosyltrehalose trehalohydrolase